MSGVDAYIHTYIHTYIVLTNALNVSGFADKFALKSYATHYNIIACHSSGRIQLDVIVEYKYNMGTLSLSLSLSVCVCVCVCVCS